MQRVTEGMSTTNTSELEHEYGAEKVLQSNGVQKLAASWSRQSLLANSFILSSLICCCEDPERLVMVADSFPSFQLVRYCVDGTPLHTMVSALDNQAGIHQTN